MSPVVRGRRTAPTPLGTLVLIVALLVTAAPLSAQLGGLTKKVKPKVSAPSLPGGSQGSTDQPARLPGPEVTKSSVDQLLLGLKAEKAALDREAAAAQKRQEAEERRKKANQQANDHGSCVQAKTESDPEYLKLQQMGKDAEAAAKSGDNQKAVTLATQMPAMMQAVNQRAEAACAQSTPAPAGVSGDDAAAMEAAPGNSGADAAKAAGMSQVDYGQLKELVYTYFQSPKRAGLTSSEEQAVNGRRADLQAAFRAIGMGL